MHVGIYMVDPFQRDQVVFTIVGIRSGQLDPALAFHVIYGAYMATISGTHFHVLANFVFRNHFCFLRCFFDLHGGNENEPISFPFLMRTQLEALPISRTGHPRKDHRLQTRQVGSPHLQRDPMWMCWRAETERECPAPGTWCKVCRPGH